MSKSNSKEQKIEQFGWKEGYMDGVRDGEERERRRILELTEEWRQKMKRMHKFGCNRNCVLDILNNDVDNLKSAINKSDKIEEMKGK